MEPVFGMIIFVYQDVELIVLTGKYQLHEIREFLCSPLHGSFSFLTPKMCFEFKRHISKIDVFRYFEKRI
jgi:hypothetical protein